jgi:hypothetical protein
MGPGFAGLKRGERRTGGDMRKLAFAASTLAAISVALFSLPGCATPNNPPDVPTTPDGPGSGGKRVNYSFRTFSQDLDPDSIAIQFDWGDGENLVWGVYFGIGGDYFLSHAWFFSGSYEVRARARDVHGKVSEWSSPALIVIN